MDNETKHTPGPWTIRQESINPEWHIVAGRWGRIVANIHIETNNEMDEANARLIASAPDLLAERDRLREINAELLAALQQIELNYTDGYIQGHRTVLQQARAAIAKAETANKD